MFNSNGTCPDDINDDFKVIFENMNTKIVDKDTGNLSLVCPFIEDKVIQDHLCDEDTYTRIRGWHGIRDRDFLGNIGFSTLC